jgi:hypothetical protein
MARRAGLSEICARLAGGRGGSAPADSVRCDGFCSKALTPREFSRAPMPGCPLRHVSTSRDRFVIATRQCNGRVTALRVRQILTFLRQNSHRRCFFACLQRAPMPIKSATRNTARASSKTSPKTGEPSSLRESGFPDALPFVALPRLCGSHWTSRTEPV